MLIGAHGVGNRVAILGWVGLGFEVRAAIFTKRVICIIYAHDGAFRWAAYNDGVSLHTRRSGRETNALEDPVLSVLPAVP